MRRHIFLLMTIYLFIPITLLAGDKTVNFSGDWSLNQEKSLFDEGRGRRAATTISASQKQNELTIKRTSQTRNGEERITEEKLTLDGKECKNSVRNSVVTSVAKWSSDGKTLTITSKMIFEREGNEIEIHTTESWTLKENGKVLAIDFTSKSPRGERKGTYIYDKAKGSE